MPSTLFDSAVLAIVAYTQVDGATGVSTSTSLANSGVGTTRVSTGVYQVFLPTAIAQDASRDLIFVQPKAVPSTTAIQLYCGIVANVVEEDATSKQVTMKGVGGGLMTTSVDSDFSFFVLRTILP
jgi:hypothetical protein